MSAVVDFHSHILPGIDDGSASIEESLSMLRMEAEQGIAHVVATPHFYAKHDRPTSFLKRRAEAEKCLREAMEAHPGLPQITVGAEVYFFPGMSNSDELLGLTFGINKCIMLEMPHPPWTKNMFKELESIYVRLGILPVLAHIDRYIRPFQTYGIPERLHELPVLVQANANFFLHSLTKGMAMRMLKEDRIQLLGSDCHNLSTRKPNLGQAVGQIVKRLGSEALERIDAYQKDALVGHENIF